MTEAGPGSIKISKASPSPAVVTRMSAKKREGKN